MITFSTPFKLIWAGIWSIDDKLRELPSEYKANINKAKKSKKTKDKVTSRGKKDGKDGWSTAGRSGGEIGESDRKTRSTSRREYLFARGGG